MELLIILAAGAFGLLALAAAVGVLAFGDRAFATRLTTLRRSDVRGKAQEDLRRKLFTVLAATGAKLSRGELSGDKRGPIRLKLIQAGFFGEHAVEAYFAVRVLAALGLATVVVVVMVFMQIKPSLLGMGGVILAANVGLYMPRLLISSRIQERATAVRVGMPDATDLMVVCAEAGQTMGAAMQRVEAEFGALHPVLAEQFRFAMLEMQAGSSRAEALQRMAERVAAEEMRALVALVVQSEALGASLGQTLRAFSDDLRRTRFLEAERKAAELPVKITFPLVFCIFPCLMGVIFTPIVLRLMRVLLHAGE